MSYNIRNIKTVNSNLEIMAGNARDRLEHSDLPEDCFLYDLDLDHYSDEDVLEVGRLAWSGTWSGNSFDYLKEILVDDCTGDGEFVVVWEDGETSGLKVSGEGKSRKVTEPKLKMQLE